MSEFAQRTAEWQPFYSTLGGVSATMAGLLFTSLTLNPQLLRNAYLKVVAQQSFVNFSLLLMLALLLLQPRQQPIRLATAIVVLGVTSLVRLMAVLRGLKKSGVLPSGESWAARLLRLSQVAYALMVGIGAMILMGVADALYLLQAIVVILLAGTGRLCWELLHQGKPATEEQGDA